MQLGLQEFAKASRTNKPATGHLKKASAEGVKFLREMKLSTDKVNVNGGAIAMGHPLGATGAMILGSVLDELERRNLTTALITLCIGAGMGTATIIERV